jgi:methionyl-tRNA formyltransferase
MALPPDSSAERARRVRVVYLGTPPDAVRSLRALHEAGHEIPLVVTQPDRKRGRGGALVPSPVKVAAEALGLTVATPERAREVVEQVAATGAELGVVVAFGQLLPTALLEALPHGFVNVHFSLLPRWRGAAPVERAILAGDEETGVGIMALEAGLDTGPIFASERTPIDPNETAGELRSRLVEIGTDLLLRTLPDVPTAEPVPQAGEPTYAEKLTVEEFELDPTAPAEVLARIVRAGNPRPGAWIIVDGKRLKVWRGHVEADRFVPDEVQPEGKRAMPFTAWLGGHRGTAPFA